MALAARAHADCGAPGAEAHAHARPRGYHPTAAARRAAPGPASRRARTSELSSNSLIIYKYS